MGWAGVYEISVALNGQQFSSSASSFRIYTLPTFAAFVERGTAVTGGGTLSVLGYFLITPVVLLSLKSILTAMFMVLLEDTSKASPLL